jgi:hypothetical protein
VPPQTIDVQTPALDEAQDQKSLHSISGTSISNPSESLKVNVNGEMPTVEVQTAGLKEPPRPQTSYAVTGSLDRRYYGNFDTDTQAIVRRAQTLRTTDYASRLRERIRTFRPQTVDSSGTDGGVHLSVNGGGAGGEIALSGGGSPVGDTLKRQTLRPKQEVYVCSESFRIPHKLLKFKRRKTSPPKTVRSSGQEITDGTRQKYDGHYDYEQDFALEGQVEPIVYSKTEYAQRVPPPIPRAPIQRPHISTNIAVSGQPGRQLTSLRSAASPTLLQQSTAVPDSSGRGMLQMVSVGDDGFTTESQAVALPYLSGELSNMSKIELLTNISVDEKVFEATCSDKKPIIRDALCKVHPFMDVWMAEDSKPGAEQANTEQEGGQNDLMRSCLQEYLNTCIRLRSVDLQGQYAPFHYPLVTFNERFWKVCAKLSGWEDLIIKRGPEWNTEYLRLPQNEAEGQSLVFPNTPVDTMVINWLNCHQTVVPTPADSELKKAVDTVAYHPVQILTTLDQLLETYAEDQPSADLWNSCIRLAVLLTYNYCLVKYRINTEQFGLDPNPANILVDLCTSNCLVIFHRRSKNAQPEAKDAKQITNENQIMGAEQNHEEGEAAEQKKEAEEKPESENKTETEDHKTESEQKQEASQEKIAETHVDTDDDLLLKAICPNSKSIEEAIDNETERLYHAACSRFRGKDPVSCFFRAIAPPDWMAMTVARVCMKKE